MNTHELYKHNATLHHDILKKEYRGQTEDRNKTVQDILRLMIRETAKNPMKQWYFAHEVSDKVYHYSNLEPLSFSYKGSARLSDLANLYPNLIQKKSLGKFRIYRIMYEQLSKITLPNEIAQIIKEELDKNGIDINAPSMEKPRKPSPSEYRLVNKDGRWVAVH